MEETVDRGLTGKVALVTGGGSQIGLGNAIALTLAKEGCDIVVTDIDFILDVVLKGPLKCTKAVIEHMISRKTGKIINISSIVGVNPQSYISVYSAAKAGVMAFTKSPSYELAPYGINVNSATPGFMHTNFGGVPLK